MRISFVSLKGRRGKLLRWAVSSAIVGCVVLPAASTGAPTPAVAPPAESLTSQWWQAYVAIPAKDAAKRCDIGTGAIVFLGATSSGKLNRSCELQAGTSILVDLINVECSSLEVGTDFFGANPGQQLTCAKGFADKFTPLHLTINGTEVGNLSGLRVRSQPFQFSPVSGNEFGIPAGTGGSVSDGYWALIGPLAAGSYEIFASGTFDNGAFTTRITYRLRVV